MKEQIEEMARDLANHSFFYNGGCMMNYSLTAKLLYNAGYRKQKEGEWQELDICAEDMYCSVCGGIAPVDCEKEAFYKSNFCPNCGAKMKGGAE